MQSLTETLHVIKGLDPVADAFAGTVRSDVVSMKNKKAVLFYVYKGVGTTGTSTITVNACDNFTPSNRTAIPFRYRRCANSGDVQGALTAVAAAGVATTAGSSEIYVVEVLPEYLGNTGYPNVELTLTEVVDSPVLGGIMILAVSQESQAVTPTAIA